MSAFERIAQFFAGWSSARLSDGPIGRLTSLLAAERMDPADYDALCAEFGVCDDPGFRVQALDLVVAYVEHALERGAPGTELAVDAIALRRFLRIPDGEFAERRPGEVARVLNAQLTRVLEDFEIDSAEELYQVELQTAFGLSYDDYLRFAQPALERTFAALREAADTSQAADVTRKLALLEPVYRLAAGAGM